MQMFLLVSPINRAATLNTSFFFVPLLASSDTAAISFTREGIDPYKLQY